MAELAQSYFHILKNKFPIGNGFPSQNSESEGMEKVIP